MDINAEYKSRFSALTEQLGRTPDTRDKEWWVLTEWMRKEYEHGRTTPNSGGHLPTGTGDGRAARGRATADLDTTGDHDGDGPASGPATAPITSERVTPPNAPSVSPALSQWALAASGSYALSEDYTRESRPYAPDRFRGPNGGVMATCTDCGRAWERPVSRGRPARRCGECR